MSLLIQKLDPDTILTHLPIEIVLSLLEAGQDGHGAVESGKLLLRDRVEPRVLHGTGDGVFPETIVKAHG